MNDYVVRYRILSVTKPFDGSITVSADDEQSAGKLAQRKIFDRGWADFNPNMVRVLSVTKLESNLGDD